MGSLNLFGIGFLISGGRDGTTVYSDVILYHVQLNAWLEYNYDYFSNYPRFGSCLLNNGLTFFIIGGETYSQISRDIVIFDFSINLGIPTDYKLPLEITGFSCTSRNYNNKYQIVIAGGNNIQNLPENKIIIINVLNSKSGMLSFEHEILKSNKILLPSYSALIYDNNWIHIFGGVFTSNVVSNYIISINLETNETMWNNLSYTFGLFSHTAVKYLDEIYIFGGVKGSSSVRIMNYGGNNLYKYKFDQTVLNMTCLNGKREETCKLCERGTYYSDGNCLPCITRTYSDMMGASSLFKCYYCKYGTYNDKLGSRYCKECPSDKTCYIGSKLPTKFENTQENKSIQPESYDSNTDKQNILVYKVIGFTILASFSIIIIFLLVLIMVLIQLTNTLYNN